MRQLSSVVPVSSLLVSTTRVLGCEVSQGNKWTAEQLKCSLNPSVYLSNRQYLAAHARVTVTFKIIYALPAIGTARLTEFWGHDFSENRILDRFYNSR
jgi:hypothetical protein